MVVLQYLIEVDSQRVLCTAKLSAMSKSISKSTQVIMSKCQKSTCRSATRNGLFVPFGFQLELEQILCFPSLLFLLCIFWGNLRKKDRTKNRNYLMLSRVSRTAVEESLHNQSSIHFHLLVQWYDMIGDERNMLRRSCWFYSRVDVKWLKFIQLQNWAFISKLFPKVCLPFL